MLLAHFVTVDRILIPKYPGLNPEGSYTRTLLFFLSSSYVAASLRAEPLGPSIHRDDEEAK